MGSGEIHVHLLILGNRLKWKMLLAFPFRQCCGLFGSSDKHEANSGSPAVSVHYLSTTFLEEVCAHGLEETASMYEIEDLSSESFGAIRKMAPPYRVLWMDEKDVRTCIAWMAEIMSGIPIICWVTLGDIPWEYRRCLSGTLRKLPPVDEADVRVDVLPLCEPTSRRRASRSK